MGMTVSKTFFFNSADEMLDATNYFEETKIPYRMGKHKAPDMVDDKMKTCYSIKTGYIPVTQMDAVRKHFGIPKFYS